MPLPQPVIIGNATMYCGDCLEILPTLQAVDAVVTDPPYGIYAHGGKWGRKDSLQWDKKPADNMEQLLAAGQHQIIWGGNYFQLPPSRGWLVWQKPDRLPTTADVELAWTSMNMNARLLSHSIAATNKERVGHPTQKPLRVMHWCLSFLPTSKTVLDPYMGSGSTGAACVTSGRRFIGIEIDPDYFEIACQRMEKAQQQTYMAFEAA